MCILFADTSSNTNVLGADLSVTILLWVKLVLANTLANTKSVRDLDNLNSEDKKMHTIWLREDITFYPNVYL